MGFRRGSLAGLADVDLTGAQPGQALVLGAGGLWTPGAVASATEVMKLFLPGPFEAGTLLTDLLWPGIDTRRIVSVRAYFGNPPVGVDGDNHGRLTISDGINPALPLDMVSTDATQDLVVGTSTETFTTFGTGGGAGSIPGHSKIVAVFTLDADTEVVGGTVDLDFLGSDRTQLLTIATGSRTWQKLIDPPTGTVSFDVVGSPIEIAAGEQFTVTIEPIGDDARITYITEADPIGGTLIAGYTERLDTGVQTPNRCPKIALRDSDGLVQFASPFTLSASIVGAPTFAGGDLWLDLVTDTGAVA